MSSEEYKNENIILEAKLERANILLKSASSLLEAESYHYVSEDINHYLKTVK